MSGTSLDGVDIVYVKFEYLDKWEFTILKAETIPYSKEWLKSLSEAFHYNQSDLDSLDNKYADYLANIINKFIKNNNIATVDFIASHGHTIHHKPEENYTLQIGDGNIIATKTKIKTVYDFRTQDVALGGQGAPLVPIGDDLLFSNYKYCLNLGGFANISFKKGNDRIAYDICAVNTVLNHFAKKRGFDYDDSGNMAKKGTLNTPLYKDLNNLPYYTLNHPKSLGVEYLNDIILPLINIYKTIKIEDILHTFTEHAAYQIAKNTYNKGSLFITGGGAFNTYLIQRIKHHTTCDIIIPKKEIVDFKEALIFAFLGLLRLKNKTNCLRSVTGASKNHSSGIISNNISR